MKTKLPVCEEYGTHRNLVLMIGPTMSGKTTYVNRYLGKLQLISEYYVKRALLEEDKSLPHDMSYFIMSVMCRSFMLNELSIVTDEQNLDIESLMIWRKLASEYKYFLEGVLLDTPYEVCLERAQKVVGKNKDYTVLLKKQFEKFEELKTILNMKHHKIFDNLIIVKPEEKQDEVL
jgi:predicted kinase